MIFTLEALPAQEGDCLLLHWGTKTKPNLAIIDAGPGRVFEESLLVRLTEIRKKLKLKKQDRLRVELVMVSHVDADHITGVKKLFRRLAKEVADNETERPFQIRRLWHNTFNDILGDDQDAHYERFTAGFTASTSGGEPTPKVNTELKSALAAKGAKHADQAAYDVAKILASHAEGRELRDSHVVLFDAQQIAGLNSPFTGLITSSSKAVTVNGLKVRPVGPMQDELDALQAEFDTFLEKKKLTAEAALAAYADESIPNLSSIVCLVEAAKKRILLTGDARGDYILEALRRAKLLKSGKLTVDVLKVPHHGSARNVEADFFETIIAKTYVFSGNGKHGNPDRETLEMLIDARGKSAKYTIVLTYPVKETDALRRKEMTKKKKKWVAAKHALESLFAAKKKAGFQFTLVAGAPAKVELGTEKVPY